MRDISYGYLSNLTIQTWQFDLLIEQHNECMSNKDIAHHHQSITRNCASAVVNVNDMPS